MDPELVENEERYRALFESLDCIYVLDLQGRFIDANRASLELLGYTAEDIPMLTVSSLLDEDQLASAHELLAEIQRHGRLRERREFRLRRKNGDHVDVEVNGSIISRDGRPYAVLGIARDISERKRIEAALRESQERYRTLVSLGPDAIVVDAGGRFAFANPAAARLFGAESPDELVGMDVIERMHPDFRELVAARAAQVAAGMQTPPREIKILRLDGTAVDVEATGARIEFDGRWANQVVYRDITERKQAEARERELERQLLERQKLESLGVLAGGIAHDFNNMLTTILGYSHMILAGNKSLSEADLADIREIKAAAERAKALTGSILAFSRRQPREPQLLALSALIADLEPFLRRTLGEDVDLVLNASPESCLVEMDPSQFTQVLMNLVVNARDAMPAGGTLTVEVYRRVFTENDDGVPSELTPGDWCVLVVSDTGMGMDSTVLPRIFEPFFTTKAPGEGTGLGLSTTYGIVRQSGGEIRVISEPGRGSSFEIYLPRAGARAGIEARTPAAPAGGAEPTEARPAAGKTILLVEDEPSVRRLATRLLEYEGYNVLVAADGPQALSIAANRAFAIDLLLTDVVLPGALQGDEVARAVVRERPGLKVILMSGYPRDARLYAGDLGEDVHYLEKPFTADALATVLRQLLESGT